VREALALELRVADGEDLIDQQNLRLDVDSHRKPETDVHPGGVRAHRLIEELTQFGELRDARQRLACFLQGEAEENGVEQRVLAAADLGMEARTEVEQRGHAAVPHLAA
jgi:hypothetical protein